VQFEFSVPAGAVVEQQDRTIFRRVLLQRQHLAPIAERIFRQHAYFRQSVDDQAVGLIAVDLRHNGLGAVVQLNFRRVKDGVLRFRLQLFPAGA
jgi:hypothetical protein